MTSLKGLLVGAVLLKIISLIDGKTSSCPTLQKPEKISIPELMGNWHAVRGIEHSSTERSNNAKRTRSCPTITLTQKGEAIEFRWQSKDKPERKFDLQINPNVPGLWEHKRSKKGSNQDIPFRSLQVTMIPGMEAVWGATMCKSGGRVASVVLSRKPEFPEKEAQIISNKLAEQGLTIDNSYDRCAT